MGAMVAAVLGAMVAGAAVAKPLHDRAPLAAWFGAAGLCAGVFAGATLFDGRRESRPRLIVLLASAALTFSYLLVLGGESFYRPPRRDALAFATFVAELLAVLSLAAAVPMLIITGALRRRHAADAPRVRPFITPQALALGLGVCAFAAGIALLAATLWFTPSRLRAFALLALALGGPVVFLPLWTYINERVFERWAAAPAPSLSRGLERLRQGVGFDFKRILCLDDSLAGGRLCGVIVGYGRATLLISRSLSDVLTTDQLLAVLAHEAAHVRLNHSRRKEVWGFFGAVIVLATGVAGLTLVSPFIPRTFGFAGALIVLLPLGVLRGLYDTFVIRRHEAEADAFAVQVAGARALIEALEVLGASGPPGAAMHNRWTTHGTWEQRASRIIALGSRGTQT